MTTRKITSTNKTNVFRNRILAIGFVFVGMGYLHAEESKRTSKDILGIRRITKNAAGADEPTRFLKTSTHETFNEKPDEPNQRTVDWLSTFANEQAMFERDAILELQKAVSHMTDIELQAWLEANRMFLERLESPQWELTSRWLDDFLEVQTYYSKDELNSFQKKIGSMNADQLSWVMDHFERTRQSREQGNLVFNNARKQTILNRSLQSRSNRLQAASIVNYSGGRYIGPGRGNRNLQQRVAPRYSERVADFYIRRAIYGNFMRLGR